MKNVMVIMGTLALIVVAPACSTNDNEAAPLPQTALPAKNTVTQQVSPQDAAKAAAQETTRRYYAVIGDVAARTVPMDALGGVLTERMAAPMREGIVSSWAKGWTSKGAPVARSMAVDKVTLPPDSKSPGEIWVKVCADFGPWVTVDSAGKVQRNTKLTEFAQRWRLENASWSNPSGWRIAGQNIPLDTPC